MTPLSLLVLALADPLPVAAPKEDVELPQPELPADSGPLRDERYALGLGVTVAFGAYQWQSRWTAVATLGADLQLATHGFELHVVPHATVYVHAQTEGLFGFEGELVLPLGEVLACSVGTEQLVELSRLQAGALRFGPSLRPFIVRAGRHRLSLQLVWLPLGVNVKRYPGCAECSEPPLPFYAVGYGVFF